MSAWALGTEECTYPTLPTLDFVKNSYAFSVFLTCSLPSCPSACVSKMPFTEEDERTGDFCASVGVLCPYTLLRILRSLTFDLDKPSFGRSFRTGVHLELLPLDLGLRLGREGERIMMSLYGLYCGRRHLLLACVCVECKVDKTMGKGEELVRY